MLFANATDLLIYLSLICFEEEAGTFIEEECWMKKFYITDDEGNELDYEYRLDPNAILDTIRRCGWLKELHNANVSVMQTGEILID